MMFSAWNAKIATSVASSATTVTGWNLVGNRWVNQSLPLWRINQARHFDFLLARNTSGNLNIAWAKQKFDRLLHGVTNIVAGPVMILSLICFKQLVIPHICETGYLSLAKMKTSSLSRMCPRLMSSNSFTLRVVSSAASSRTGSLGSSRFELVAR